MRIRVLVAMAAFLVLAAGQSFAACNTTQSTDCDVVSVSISADADEYTIGSTSTIYLKVTAWGNPSAADLRTVDIEVTKQRPGFEPDAVTIPNGYREAIDVDTPPTGVVTYTVPVNISDYQPGLYAFNAIIEKVNGSAQVYDAVKTDNHASAYVTLKKQGTQVPEISPLLAIAAALSVLFIAARK